MKAILRSGFLTLAIMLALAVLANAGPLEDGLAAADQGDSETARRLWRPLAEQGNAKAQVYVAGIYYIGKGVPQDYTEAANWFHKAAEQGDVTAQSVLGTMYVLGDGVRQDDAEAVKWYRLAAEQGDAGAQYNLGRMYGNGRGVKQDRKKKRYWSVRPLNKA